jgi:hypothetical protein
MVSIACPMNTIHILKPYLGSILMLFSHICLSHSSYLSFQYLRLIFSMHFSSASFDLHAPSILSSLFLPPQYYEALISELRLYKY